MTPLTPLTPCEPATAHGTGEKYTPGPYKSVRIRGPAGGLELTFLYGLYTQFIPHPWALWRCQHLARSQGVLSIASGPFQSDFFQGGGWGSLGVAVTDWHSAGKDRFGAGESWLEGFGIGGRGREGARQSHRMPAPRGPSGRQPLPYKEIPRERPAD